MFSRWLRLARDAFVLYSITEMVRQIAATGPNSHDIRQITVRIPAPVLAKLERLAAHAVQTKSQFIIKLLQQVPDVEVVEDKPEPLTPLQARICTWFGRRETTRWTQKEKLAYKQHAHLTVPEDVEVLERYYLANIPKETDYRRRDISTLLANWPSELDRARIFVSAIRKKREIGHGWSSAASAFADNGRNLSQDEVKAGVAELRNKLGLPLVQNPQVRETPLDDLEGVDL